MSQIQGEEQGTAMPTAVRNRAVIETYVRHEAALRRTAVRFSLCEDDAEDALQRALEILLRKAPSEDPRELVRWTQTVVRHEALALRRERERILRDRPPRRSSPGARTGPRWSPPRAPGRPSGPSARKLSPAAARRCRR